MVDFILSDLEFILKQIKIAEAHAGGATLYGTNGLIPSYNLAWGLRTVDGSYNNLLNERWGASDQQFPHLLDPVYRPAAGTPFDPDGPAGPAPAMPTSPNYNPSNNPNSLVFDPSIRTISNLLVDQTLGNPAAILTALERAGSVDPLGDLPAVTAIYTTFKPAWDAEYDARVVMQSAKSAADALGDADPNTPPSPAEQNALDALAAATSAYQASVADLEAARVVRNAALEPYGIAMDGDDVLLTNIAPDEGLSAPFNSWFTLFGQFFDHGLDLVNKGGSGTVFVPLQPDDPLYVPGSHTNFMVLTRATVSAGADGVMGTADDVGPVNTTTSFVDQNQTYSSHPAHQVFLRQYEVGPDGKPQATGRLIEGANGGMATWGEVKAQAAMLGILLEDKDVGSVPLVRTDQYGNFIPNAAGYAQLVVGLGPDGIPNTADDVVISGTPAAPVSTETAVRTAHAFLADIAHDAVPVGKIADGDITIGLGNPGNGDAEYDNELLDAHFIAGDGRVNENIGLTAVHHVFHAEHNRLVQHTKDVAIVDAQKRVAEGATQAEAVAFLNEWLQTDVASVPVTAGDIATLNWDGERLFQAAKFGTEMQYQHLVFEEFARKIQPAINVFLVPDGFDVTLDPNIVAEFAHVVYRFGHSMLTETIDRYDPTFTSDQISLIDGFLNPSAFNGVDGVIDDGIAAGAIIRGMTRQAGNEIDEFVTGALRNNLLGLPLDLATINLARGRDTGVPSLNAARRDFYEASNQNALMKPYESWVDFAGHLKNEASIINFIAAYGTHSLVTGQTTIEGKRDAALTIITGASVGGLEVPGDAEAFLNATGAYAGGALGGLENVDLWIGGLAEETMPFGGMLGSTFNFVFEVQMENLQSGDRFYYLQRLDGLHLFGEMEGNSFAAMIMRNTDATHLPSDVFSAPGLILEVDQSKQYNDLDGDGTLESTDPTGSGLLTKLVIRNDPGTAETDTNYLRYTGGDHVVLGGTEAADTLIAGIGDDTLFGDGGADKLQGGFGNDIINGGDGDDIIRDSGGDDNIKGGAGNDVVHAGPGLDLVMGGAGKDFIFLGTDMGSEVFAGEGDDFVFGNKNAERILGNEGNDWIETGTFDGAPGDNFDEVFAHDGIRGNDVFLGDGGFDEFIGEGGDDIMVGSAGRGKMAGMSGFDWATYKDSTTGVVADLSIPIVFDESPTLPQNAALDEYASMEGLSGSRFNDILRGSNETAATRLPADQGGTEGYLGSALDAEGIALIDGLQTLLGAGVTQFSGDIILGGDGSDLIYGNAGDDFLDGNRWLDAQIGVYTNTDGTGALIKTVNSMTELATDMFNGVYNPGQLKIVRSIKTDTTAGDVDIAGFSGARTDYDIAFNANGTITVNHARGTQADGIDTLRNIEFLRFSDQDFSANRPATGTPTIGNTGVAAAGSTFSVNTATIADQNGLGAFSYQWRSSLDGVNWTDIGGATGASFTPLNNPGMAADAYQGQFLSAVVSFVDGSGFSESLFSTTVGPVGANWSGNGDANTFNGTAGRDLANGGGGNDVLNGAGGADIMEGGTGNDTLNGGDANDTLSGGAGADAVNGDAGNDALNGQEGNDLFTGGAGNDNINGGADSDTSVYSLAARSYSISENGAAITVASTTSNEGTDTLDNVETLRFAGANYVVLAGSGAANTINGGAGNQVIFGRGGGDALNGGAGNDLIYGGAGNDTISQSSTQGRDFINGEGGNDTYQLNGDASAEAFQIMTRAAAIAGGITDLHSGTEIVIRRNGVVITELDNIEEISVNALAVTANDGNGTLNSGLTGGDTVTVVGNFAAPNTSLSYSTITVNGGRGADTVDISGLVSDHRIVFNTNGGHDQVIGTLRPQDQINGALGAETYSVPASVAKSLLDKTPVMRRLQEDDAPKFADRGDLGAARSGPAATFWDHDGGHHNHSIAMKFALVFDQADHLLN